MSTYDSPWTLDAVRQLTEMAREKIPVSVISLKLKRPIESISAKLSELGITPATETGAG